MRMDVCLLEMLYHHVCHKWFTLHFIFAVIDTDSQILFYLFAQLFFGRLGRNKCYQEFSNFVYNKFVVTTMIIISVNICLTVSSR